MDNLSIFLAHQWVQGKYEITVERTEGIPRIIASMKWHDTTGEVEWIEVDSFYQRQGIATWMWEEANRRAEQEECSYPRHSTHRTPQGHMWIQSVGGATMRGSISWV